jgi:hypothetical protein
MRSTVLCLCLFALPSAAATDPLASLDFLVGTWSGQSAGSRGTDVFRRDLDGHVLERRSHSESMQTLLTVYRDGADDRLAAIYFDNLGHVIRYGRIEVTPGERVVLVSEQSDPAPTFRLSYVLRSPGVLHVKFEMAPPGHPESYQTIAEADETRGTTWHQ